MRRAAAVGLAALWLVASLLAPPFAAWGQNDPTARRVEQSGEWNLRHLSSVTHVAGQIAQSGTWNVQHIGSVVHVTGVQSPHITTFWVASCGTGAAIAVRPEANTQGRRRDLYFLNSGTENIFLGGTHTTVTATTGFTLHAGTGVTSRLLLENFTGRVDCITANGSQSLQVIEIWR